LLIKLIVGIQFVLILIAAVLNTVLWRADVCHTSRTLRGLAIVWASLVRPSVRPSATLRYCVKTTQARITRSSPWLPQEL